MANKWYKGLLKAVPDPSVRLRQGSIPVLERYLFIPLTELQIEIPTLLATEHLIKKPISDMRRLRTHKFKTYKLFSKRKVK